MYNILSQPRSPCHPTITSSPHLAPPGVPSSSPVPKSRSACCPAVPPSSPQEFLVAKFMGAPPKNDGPGRRKVTKRMLKKPADVWNRKIRDWNRKIAMWHWAPLDPMGLSGQTQPICQLHHLGRPNRQVAIPGDGFAIQRHHPGGKTKTMGRGSSGMPDIPSGNLT